MAWRAYLLVCICTIAIVTLGSAIVMCLDRGSAGRQAIESFDHLKDEEGTMSCHDIVDVQLNALERQELRMVDNGEKRVAMQSFSELPTMRDSRIYFRFLLPLLVVGFGIFGMYWRRTLLNHKVAWAQAANSFTAEVLRKPSKFCIYIFIPLGAQVVYLTWIVLATIFKMRKCLNQAKPIRCLKSGDLHHVVVIPAFKEPWSVLQRTIATISRQTVPAHRRSLLIAFEASDPHAQKIFTFIQSTFGQYFRSLWCTTHVLEDGEEAGKAANENFAIRWLYNELGRSYDPDQVMITICDADSDFPQRHLEHVEGAYREHPGDNVIYAGALNTWGNFLDTRNPLIKVFEMDRVLVRLVTMWFQMPPYHTKVESNYSLTLGLAKRIDFWSPDVMQEDTHMQHKVMLLLRNGVPVVPVYSMICNDLVVSFSERYAQALRHAWAITQLAWVLALFRKVEFKLFLHHLIETLYRQVLSRTFSCWWLLLCFPQVWQLLCSLTGEARVLFFGIAMASLAVTWCFDTVLLAYVWYGALADRSTVLKPSFSSFMAMRLLAWPLGPVVNFLFQMVPLWHAALHAFCSYRFNYVTAPKGVKSWDEDAIARALLFKAASEATATGKRSRNSVAWVTLPIFESCEAKQTFRPR